MNCGSLPVVPGSTLKLHCRICLCNLEHEIIYHGYLKMVLRPSETLKLRRWTQSHHQKLWKSYWIRTATVQPLKFGNGQIWEWKICDQGDGKARPGPAITK